MADLAKGGLLPWGWWLLTRSGWIEDREGRRWDSVRAAFWQGLLGFPEPVGDDEHELLLRVLVGLEFGWDRSAETALDLFGGDRQFHAFYCDWLVSVGLATLTGGIGRMLRINDHGRSVMLMLQATRNPEWIDLPMPVVLKTLGDRGKTTADIDREAALRAFELEVSTRPSRFLRETLGPAFAITLVGVNREARMPTQVVIWSMGFDDEASRDQMFGWLAERIDRWDDWGRLAYRRGAAALTQHILKLIVGGNRVLR